MSTINRIANSIKFGAVGGRRIVEVSGVAYHNATTWGDDIRDAGWYENAIADALRSNGWGVYSFSFTPRTSWVQQTYDFVAKIDTMAGDNPERIRQAVFNVVSHYIPNVSASVTGDYLLTPSGGGYMAVPTVDTSGLPTAPAQLSVWEQLFGSNTSAVDAGGKVLGLSVGTLTLLGIIYIVASSRRR